MLKGKKLSVLGDSISTYYKVSNNPEYNTTIGDNRIFYGLPFPLERTYWYRVMSDLGLTLCVNNSWSGGNLSGRSDPTSGINRAHELANNEGETPDLIIFFMGMNDLGRSVSPETFASDYAETLRILGSEYPNAEVCCINYPDRDPYFLARTEQFNRILEEAVAKAGERFFVADLFHSRLNNDYYYNNTVDGLHPDEDGMRIIAEIVEGAIRSHFGLTEA